MTYYPVLTKRRLTDIETSFAQLLPTAQDVKNAIAAICTIMNFDPNCKIYTKEKNENNKKWRQKKAAEQKLKPT